jgi:adenylate kinase
VHLDVPNAELVRRLVARGEESGRSDDTVEVIQHRLEVYDSKTLPMLAYYAQREKLVSVNGARPVDEVTWSIVVQLQRVQRQLLS